MAVGAGKVFTCANDNWLIALDQRTGQVVWERQHHGYGNLEKVAVTYHDGLLHCGTNDGPRGAALAFDAATGDLVWHFWGTAARPACTTSSTAPTAPRRSASTRCRCRRSPGRRPGRRSRSRARAAGPN
ncbi:PQQ-binding-like beta-propeller repeat protein [Nonomuraea sp. AD125B]|uniref:outer membrane protein assembly factor BamB family protein n=1 Tax=Nonomuraea sp. AD125B TaxID=3242897 RepID=UPI0035297D6E